MRNFWDIKRLFAFRQIGLYKRSVYKMFKLIVIEDTCII